MAVAIALLLAWFQPPVLLDIASRVGYAVCHQIPERSYALPGRPLPLCARDTGTFLGALAGFGMIFARRRSRCQRLPPAPVMAVLVLFIIGWGFDGLNSYLSLFPDLPHLYQPHNILRLVTGMLNGIALSSIVYPVFSSTAWVRPSVQRSIVNLKELALLLLAGAVLVAGVALGWPPVVYLLAVLSFLGVLALLGLANAMIALIALRRENRAERWIDLALVLAVGAGATLAELTALNLLRSWLTQALGLPF